MSCIISITDLFPVKIPSEVPSHPRHIPHLLVFFRSGWLKLVEVVEGSWQEFREGLLFGLLSGGGAKGGGRM